MCKRTKRNTEMIIEEANYNMKYSILKNKSNESVKREENQKKMMIFSEKNTTFTNLKCKTMM